MPYFLSLLVGLVVFCSVNAQPVDSTRVLFIGNSITYFNDMPQLFRSISLSHGKPVSVDMYAPGGTGFVNHVVDPNVYDRFRNEWDVVVLQPGSGESAGASWSVDTTIHRGRVLLDSIYMYSPCAKVFLYEIPYGVPSANEYATYFSVQSRIRDSITKLSDSMHIPFLPAGECTRAYYSMHQNLLLHGGFNDIHPNLNGSYLVAASFYCGIFREAVSGTNFYAGIQQDTIVKFCSIADTVVLNHLDDWNLHNWQLNAGFSTVQSGNSYTFTDASDNATSVVWDFGDGVQSTEWNPSHSYAAGGTFVVTQYVYRGDCSDSSTIQLTVSDVGIPEYILGTPIHTTYQNDKLHIEWNEPGMIQSVTLFDATGRVIREVIVLNEKNVEMQGVKEGVYFLQLTAKNSNLSKKMFLGNFGN